MIDLTLGEIAAITGGRLAAGAAPGAIVTAPLEFDSRLLTPGGLFLAMPGSDHDGHDFAATAVAAGAVAAIVTRPVTVPSIEVTDGLTALGLLAAAVLRQLPDITVVGVTGSSGKTSTKDLLAHLLAELGPTVAPPGSFNNELGHPYTVLRADAGTRFLVLENSARGIGHIRYLTTIAPPRIGVVLNVGSAHLEGFGSRAAIALAKGELVESLPPAGAGGLAVLNGEDPAVLAMADRTAARVLTYGRSERFDIWASHIDLDELGRPRFRLHARAQPDAQAVDVSMRLSGAHHVDNALAAAAVAVECGLSVQETARALSSAQAASRWRMQVNERPDGVVVINDVYNANPESMGAALAALVAISRRRGAGRSWAVLGPMAELGDASAAEHESIGRLAARLGVSRLVVVGDEARQIAAGAVLEGWSGGGPEAVDDSEVAIALLRDELRAGDVVLVKASRAARLEQLATALLDDASDTKKEQA
jgi:UDP-N-acetylmuramoyl-tripeptide--D-alanyl-D-alanine ligase